MLKLKVIFIGPLSSGKTTIANFLADATENTGGEYHPTQGVRILQFESGDLNVHNRTVKAEVELWDCSGDHKTFESCWPALRHDTQGVVFIYDQNSGEQVREMERLYSYFVQQSGVSNKSCLVLANAKTASQQSGTIPLANMFSGVFQSTVNLEESGNKLRSDFATFLASLLSGLKDSHEQEELNIMRSLSS